MKTDKKVSNNIFQDWKVNSGNMKGRLVMMLFRLAHMVRSHVFLKILFYWYLILYKFFVGWILNIEFNSKVIVGQGFQLKYGYGCVISGFTIFGKNCTVRHLTTIVGKKLADGTYGYPPIIGDNVDIGPNVTIIGNISIGNNVILGAGTVITKDVQPNCVMVGNPARVLKKIYSNLI